MPIDFELSPGWMKVADVIRETRKEQVAELNERDAKRTQVLSSASR